MTDTPYNKYRAAAEVLHRGRETLVEALAEEILDQREDLLEGGYSFNELLENQGTRLHFLSLLVAHLEQSAEELDETRAAAAARTATRNKKPRKSRASKKALADQATRSEASRDREGSTPDDP